MSNKKTDLAENRSLALFQDKEIRRTWKYKKWFFVVEDVVAALTDSTDPKQYITRMKERDGFIREGWVQIVRTLKIETRGGMQKMNCADTKGILRIIRPNNKNVLFYTSVLLDKKLKLVLNKEYKERQNDHDFGKDYDDVDTWFDICLELGNDAWICPKCKTMYIFKRNGSEVERVYVPVDKDEWFKKYGGKK